MEGEVWAGNQPAGSRRSQDANGRVCGHHKKDCAEGKELEKESKKSLFRLGFTQGFGAFDL